MNTVSPTTVPIKKIGDGLNAGDVNSINSTLNNEVEVGNSFLKSFCNINQEENQYSEGYDLVTAIKKVPVSRRNSGLMIRFLNTKLKYCQFIYRGETLDTWNDTDYWQPIINSIDGGEW